MSRQKLFETIINVTGFTPLESDMDEIQNACGISAEVEELKSILKIGNKTQKIHELKSDLKLQKDSYEHLHKTCNDNYNKVLSLQSQLAKAEADKVELCVDFYMWMVENEYDHSIKIRVERRVREYNEQLINKHGNNK